MEFGHSQFQRVVGPVLRTVRLLLNFSTPESQRRGCELDIDFHRGLAVGPNARISEQVSYLEVNTALINSMD
jgi:hypothetical protein